MELVVNPTLEIEPDPIKRNYFTSHGLLNSNYKSIVIENFCKSTKKSVFGIRQRLKSGQFNSVKHTAVILKLSVFVMALVAIF